MSSSPQLDALAERTGRRRATKKKADPATAAARVPWIEDGIDYGPALAAFDDLATWALDLAEREVAETPADRKRVQKVRRSILGDGNRAPVSDLLFTAQILARVFDRDLDLGLADQLAIFEELDLALDPLSLLVPRMSSPTPLGARTPTRIPTPESVAHASPTVRIRFETPRSSRVGAPMPPLSFMSSQSPMRSAAAPTTPPPLRFCDECGYVHEPGDHLYRRTA